MGQRSAAEPLQSRDSAFCSRTLQQGRSEVNPVPFYFRKHFFLINHPSFDLLFVFCRLVGRLWHTCLLKAPYKYTRLALTWETDCLTLRWKLMSADHWRSIVLGATGCHGKSILILKDRQGYRRENLKEGGEWPKSEWSKAERKVRVRGKTDSIRSRNNIQNRLTFVIPWLQIYSLWPHLET